MESRIKKALELHEKGYNCTQAVACAYCDLVNMDEDIIFRMAEGFGAGMGGMDGTCGAVSGAVMLAGLTSSNGVGKGLTKAKTYKLSKAIRGTFIEKNSTLICGELKGIKTKKMLRTCSGCIEDAASIVETQLFPEMFD